MVLVALALFAVAQPGPVDTRRLGGQSDQTGKRLAEIEPLLATRPADALDQLLKLQADAGDDLVAVGGGTYQPARRAAQRLLAKLPPTELRTYRERVAGPADALLAAGRNDRDPAPLRQLLDRYFPAAASEPALMLLGELAFERGEFRRAEGYWSRLLPGDGPEPRVPTPITDPARVRALIALAATFAGEAERATRLVRELKEVYPTASGKLAGRDGVYADTLGKLTPAPPAATGPGEWAGLGGSARRDGRATGKLSRHWPSRPTWGVRLPTDEPPAVGPTPTARSAVFHPVVLNGVGYAAGPLRVWRFDPLTGRAGLAFDARSDDRLRALPLDPGFPPPPAADAGCPLTAAGGKLFARFGPVVPPPPDPTNRPTSVLVCLKPDGDGPLTAEWALPPPTFDDLPATWEAAPVWHAGRVFAAFSRLDGTTRTFGVAAYADPPGQPLWTAEVASARADGPPTARHESLTWADGRLVYCTHAGSVVALDPTTGKPAWAVRYPPPIRPLGPTPRRQGGPPLAHGGRVFVAPLDADRLMGLDADTGRELWHADGLLVDHLLGVSRGRLIASLAGPQKGVRGFDAATGDDTRLGWRQHDDPHLGGFGRGLVSDDLVLWPTPQGLFPLDPATGLPVSQPVPCPPGNLAFAAGVLLVGTPFGVSGLVPPSREPPPSPPVMIAESRPMSAPSPATETPAGSADAVTAVTRLPRVSWPLKDFQTGGVAGLDRRDPLLLVADAERVSAYRQPANAPLWVTPLPAGFTATHAALFAADVLVAGPAGACRLDRVDGRVLWQFRPPADVSDFTVVADRLACRMGGHSLVVINLADGKLAWAQDGLFYRLNPHPIPTAPGFTHLAAAGRRLLARRSDGKLFSLDPMAGDILAVESTAAVAWESAPVPVGSAVVVADGPDRIAAVFPDDLKPAWAVSAAGEVASLGGPSPQLTRVGDGVLAAVARSYGTELEYFRATDGRTWPTWRSGPVFLAAGPADLAAAGFDAQHVYVPADGRLLAVARYDGRVAWVVPLPGPGRWRAAVTPTAVVLWPETPCRAEPTSDSVARQLRRFPGLPLPVRLLGLYDAWVSRALPVVRLDPATGRELGRLNLPTVAPLGGVHAGPGPAAAVTATAIHWLN